jgi:hypothetical protein
MEKLNPHYVRGGTLPRKIKSGYVLCHNHVMHTLAMPSGVNGFRAWFNPDGPPTGFIECPCGWSGLLHYAFRDHVRATRGKCATWYQIARKSWGYTPEQARTFERRLEYAWEE